MNRRCQTYQREQPGGISRARLSLAQYTFFFSDEIFPAMNQQATASQKKTRAEQETENEANRLRDQVEAALAVVAVRSPDEVESLQTAADRIERAARDLSDALRQLAKQRRSADD
jgi:Xaa-Pro aminopeptidase